MSGFWKTWLNLWCLSVIAFGGVLACAGFVGYERGARFLLTLVNPSNPPAFTDIERFAFGLIGAITIGWGLTLFYFLRAAHASNMGNQMYRQAFVVLIIWNLIDGFISYRTGFHFNIIANLLLSLGLVIPLYWTGKLRR
jgi:hypothetical protein